VVLLGFNGKQHPYAEDWTQEIVSQPLPVLKTALTQIPDVARTPFNLPPLPTIFIWGNRDVIVTLPRHKRDEDRIIHASHSAPMLAAPAVAQNVKQFLAPAE
jgi:hypothetical protein